MMGVCERVLVSRALSGRKPYAAVKGALEMGLHNVSRWHEVMVERRNLRKYASDPGFLKDIGVSLADAMQEADKPFWKR